MVDSTFPSLRLCRGHKSNINAVVAWETYVVTASADCTIRKWDMTTLECLYVYEGHTSRVQKLIVTGEFIFSSAYDNTARMWLFEHEDNFEGNDGDPCLRTFMGHTKGVYPLIFIPSEDFDLTDGATINPGDTLLTGSADQVGKYLQKTLVQYLLSV